VIAEGNSEPELLDPKEGMSVELISGLMGIVSRVYGHGENKGVDIKLADGTMVRTTWKPEQVKPYLSKELP
jgi:preprotein translocase subunit YajC